MCAELDLRAGKLLLDLVNVVIADIRVEGEQLRVTVRSDVGGAECPGCGSWSGRVHGWYSRSVVGLPAASRNTVLVVRVRRFVCSDPGCPRRTFVEQIPGVTRRHGRWSERLRSGLEKRGSGAQCLWVGTGNREQQYRRVGRLGNTAHG